MTDKSPADLDLTRAPDPIWTRLSIVWIVPILALLVSLGVAWNSYANRGVVIEILFTDATGIVPDQTVLKYREVDVGKVESVGFTDDLQQVAVSVRVNRAVARFIDSEAKFWLVKPQVTVAGISRLDTVLSGMFIEGSWDAKPGAAQFRFTALDTPPSVGESEQGILVTLQAEDGGSLSSGAPIYFRGIQVGRLSNLRLAPSGRGVLMDAFIEAPHSSRITSSTVFWNVSGFSVSFGADGLKLGVRSLGALVQGGVEFATLSSAGTPAVDGTAFRLQADEATARRSLFANRMHSTIALSVMLTASEQSLAAGAQVIYRGQVVGEVSNQQIVISDAEGGGRNVRERIDFAISPVRMGLPDGAAVPDVLDFLDEQVAAGLRARVASTGLLGGTLALELAMVAGERPERVIRDADPNPMLPEGPPNIVDLQATAEGLLARLNALPIEELMGSANELMTTTTRLIAKASVQDTPAAALGLLEDLRKLVQSDDLQAAPTALRETLDQANGLLTELRAAKLDVALLAATTATTEAADYVRSAADGVPALIATLDQVAKSATDLPLKETVAEAQTVLARLGDLLGSETTAALPGRLGDTLDQLGGVLSDLRAGGAVKNVNAALASARDAAGAVSSASEKLPALMTRLDAAMSRITATLEAYGDQSTFNSETVAMLRELRRAAESVGSLARTLERNPNSLILGR